MTQTPVTGIQARVDRLLGIDATRYVALFGVVFIHSAFLVRADDFNKTATGIDLAARFGVPFFFTASGYFISRLPEGFILAARRVLPRVLIPFAFWSMVYVAVQHPQLSRVLTPSFFIGILIGNGPGFHLWFLSSLLVCAVLLLTVRQMSWIIAVTLAAVLYLIGLAFGAYSGPLTGHAHFLWNTRNGPFFGFLLLLSGYYLGKGMFRPPRWLGAVLFAAGLSLEAAEYHLLDQFGWHPAKDVFLGTFPLGLGAFLLAVRLPETPLIVGLAGLGRYSLGIYALHLMVLRAAIRLLPAHHSFAMQVVYVPIVMVITTIVCVMLGQIPYLRKLVR